MMSMALFKTWYKYIVSYQRYTSICGRLCMNIYPLFTDFYICTHIKASNLSVKSLYMRVFKTPYVGDNNLHMQADCFLAHSINTYHHTNGIYPEEDSSGISQQGGVPFVCYSLGQGSHHNLPAEIRVLGLSLLESPYFLYGTYVQ